MIDKRVSVKIIKSHRHNATLLVTLEKRKVWNDDIMSCSKHKGTSSNTLNNRIVYCLVRSPGACTVRLLVTGAKGPGIGSLSSPTGW